MARKNENARRKSQARTKPAPEVKDLEAASQDPKGGFAYGTLKYGVDSLSGNIPTQLGN